MTWQKCWSYWGLEQRSKCIPPWFKASVIHFCAMMHGCRICFQEFISSEQHCYHIHCQYENFFCYSEVNGTNPMGGKPTGDKGPEYYYDLNSEREVAGGRSFSGEIHPY